ncbi:MULTISPECIES: DUF2892 domain-containing protein [unclassified Clostridium]|uniref:YgaP family membrane protein n=1 Tax=unclassified Clostridium TaxID=2614128 RepID=UPI00029727FD|nr:MULTISPECIES: DUF2892 domain-containing protein [unclassified Clostridium]EKQ56172.1 MAG: Protein of unknown function (DUF2892) [Clostridium sp. Maddingley MBC34-26]
MKKAAGIDKVFRFIIGLILLSVIFWGDGNLKYLGIVGVIPIVSATFDICPLCLISGKKSCKIKK